MKTMAELEAECTDGFRNPAQSEEEFNAVMKRAEEKSAREATNTPIDESEEDEEE